MRELALYIATAMLAILSPPLRAGEALLAITVFSLGLWEATYFLIAFLMGALLPR
jgi:hypothetical protein